MRYVNDPPRIYAQDADGAICAFILFEERGDLLILTQTHVEPRCQGIGLAAQLMKHAAAYARSQDKPLQPQCSFAAEWFRRHRAQYDDILYRQTALA